MATRKRIAVIGAGPGGLAAACLLQSRGYQVTLFEALQKVGGRNSKLKLGDYSFDTGPTFFLMPQVLAEIFQKTGKSLRDYIDLKRVDPLYKLDFGDGSTLFPRANPREMAQELSKLNSRDAESYFLFRERQKNKFESILPTLKNNAESLLSLMKLESLSALPFLDFRSVYEELSDYFEDERVRLTFTFQAKYLGMSPFECPSLFTILPHIEHDLGVWHPVGGCSEISSAMARLFCDLGGDLRLSTPIEKVITQNSKITALKTESGQVHSFDDYVLGADFAYSMKSLFENSERKKYNDAKIESLKLSCSTFMIYLGLDKKFEMPHHSIYFSGNYRKNLREIFETFEIPNDPSFYVHNPSLIDGTLAPEGHSSLYILVPVPRLKSENDSSWNDYKQEYKEKILSLIESKTGNNLRAHIQQEKIITPLDWQQDYRVFKGATFSLAHTPDQLLFNRPHNQSDDFNNLFVVGGGTHPGSGLPTIFESGRIAADLIDYKYKSLNIEKGISALKMLGRGLAPVLSKAKNIELGFNKKGRNGTIYDI